MIIIIDSSDEELASFWGMSGMARGNVSHAVSC